MSALDEMVNRYNEILELQVEMVRQFKNRLKEIEERVELMEKKLKKNKSGNS